MSPRSLITAGVVGAGLLLGGVLGASSRSVPIPSAESGPADSSRVGITVHVAGWVLSPGVVQLPDGALVVDAVAAAGGAADGANLDSLNLARPLVDGDHIEVPGPATSDAGGTQTEGLISLNRATAGDLEELPGVGPVLASRIVAHRELNGPFESIEDLLDVSGVGEAKLAMIRDLVSVP